MKVVAERERSQLRRRTAVGAGLVVLTVLSGLLVAVGSGVSSPARAADGCGEGYHAQGNYAGLTDSGSKNRDGRTVIAKVGGYLTACTRDRTAALDQFNQRVVIGLPNDAYASGQFSGSGIKQVCLTHRITVTAKNIDQGSAISISGLSVGWSKSYGDKTATVSSAKVCASAKSLLRSFPADIKFTTPNVGYGITPDSGITKVSMRSSATLVYDDGSTRTLIEAGASASHSPNYRGLYDTDQQAPTLDKPLLSLTNPTSRTAAYTISAIDDSGQVTSMRVKATGDADWRPWVAYQPQGTVILPDRYGPFTVFFQVRDEAGNTSSARAADNVTRVQDITGPGWTGMELRKPDPGSRTVEFILSAIDDYSGVTGLRVMVSGEDWRPWVPYVTNGTVILPDGWGRFGLTFQLRDGAGNPSAPLYAGAVERTASVSLDLRQISNVGVVRSCGAESNPCTDVARRFRTTITSPVSPPVNLLLKAWRWVDGSWMETTQSPLMTSDIAGRSVVDLTLSHNLLGGLWRFQAQVPRESSGVSAFAASQFQYLRIG